MPPESKHIYTVSQITQEIETIFKNTFGLGIWVEGEVSNFRAAASGHFYFSLKDEKAILNAAMFSRVNREVKFKIEDGQKVICFGKIDVYGPRGQYQIIIEKIEPKGIGGRQLAFEQLKERLFKEGLFDPAHKKELPLMPFSLGIVTSETGAAIRDILGILKKGAPGVDVVIRSVRVQGEGAASEIASGIEELNEFSRQANLNAGGIPQNAGGKIDLIIVSRGGGSTEDLWAFNEEVVARAVYNSKVPIISAVGHQINTSLCDLVADIFVETPTAAAKIVVDKKNFLLAELANSRHELGMSISDIINSFKNEITRLKHSLKSPLDRLEEKEQFLDELSVALNNSARQLINITRERARSLIERLEALSPLAVLSRGYSLSVAVLDGAIVKDAARLKPKDKIKTILSKGAFISSVEEVIDG
ncbi:MAG: exodeoxyribonuclease VII large subunit [Candidatus Omnitrophica bacterium CG08_land_8_20_14_0_20_41_16]|uniref:Exodeoxyribonuclease 7 large subunit n=1 Tax=Candidatus Sherwoodlollariibacterium unditelluris TaxID=1974757 RepID=A0A2G9YIR8_9BACT|nr:MAG: exodeoxyribonuclease VII large subunit [Candidatus Omnitrophica bacterium CG23_combo_of_CG06-09_8_20_14_all_41_10]PIS33515.1 MAG: exodeoxyribonuclease VII large subunit [Candidatus Omnitrophica bacterium CG08_land_8_20_14_0_20_41_16]